MVLQTGLLVESRLRTVTQRLVSTPNKQLPQLIPFLADTIAGSREVLSSLESVERSKDDSEPRVLIHKLKTQLSTLLQEKNAGARWSAVVLIKAAIESGGWNILQGSGAWTRGMLGILGRPDSTTTKRLCIITLTRIFLLTQGRQSLLREITTPSIPPFVTSCMNIISLRRSAQELRSLDLASPLLDTVLQALIRLVPHHPSSFRPFVTQLRSLIVPLLAPTPSSSSTEAEKDATHHPVSGSAVTLAQKLHALLPQCAPKNSSNEEWGKSVKDALAQIHVTAGRVFRAVSEEWSPYARLPANQADVDTNGDVLNDGVAGPLGLPGWRGIEAGCERLVGLLQLLESLIAVQSSSTYTLPAGAILSSVERILSVTVPPTSSSQKTGDQARINPEVGREEREGMWLGLPRIHVAATAVLTTLIKRLDTVSIASTQGVLEQLLWVFQRERGCPEIRRSIYGAVIQILAFVGPSMPRATVSSMSPLIRALCEDLLPESKPPEMISRSSIPGTKKPSNNGVDATNADSYLQSQETISDTAGPVLRVREVATDLLPVILFRIPQAYLSVPLRSLIDRTAILTKNEKAMLASVLNPQERLKGKQTSSILPLYARSSALSLEIEGILRPRMPVLQQSGNVNGALDAENEMDVDVDVGTEESLAGYQRVAGQAMSGTNAVPSEEATDLVDDTRTMAENERTLSQMMTLDKETKPSSSLNLASPKRTRTIDDPEMPIEGSFSDSALPASKRARLDPQMVHTGQVTVSSAPIHEPASVITTQTDAIHKSVAVSEGMASGGHGVAGGNESDDSFEIPPIILDSDSDEEDEEDEEGEEEGSEPG